VGEPRADRSDHELAALLATRAGELLVDLRQRLVADGVDTKVLKTKATARRTCC
jgi:hypothetical protein